MKTYKITFDLFEIELDGPKFIQSVVYTIETNNYGSDYMALVNDVASEVLMDTPYMVRSVEEVDA